MIILPRVVGVLQLASKSYLVEKINNSLVGGQVSSGNT